MNLLNNACEATARFEPDERRSVTVSTRQKAEWVEIAVADNGPGIAEENLPEIFEPLYSSKTFGVGLGLALVKQVLEQHGGVAAVDSEPGRGACFVLALPLNVPPEAGETSASTDH